MTQDLSTALGFAPVPMEQWETTSVPMERARSTPTNADRDHPMACVLDQLCLATKQIKNHGNTPAALEHLGAILAWDVPGEWRAGSAAKDLMQAVMQHRFSVDLFQATVDLGIAQTMLMKTSGMNVRLLAHSTGDAVDHVLGLLPAAERSEVVERVLAQLPMGRPESVKKSTRSVLDVVYARAPQQTRDSMFLETDPTTSGGARPHPALAVFLGQAIDRNDEHGLFMLLSPDHLGHRGAIQAWAAQQTKNTTISHITGLISFLDKHPLLSSFFAESFPAPGIIAAKHPHAIMGAYYAHYLGAVPWVRSDDTAFEGTLLAHVLASGNTSIVQDLTRHPSTRSQLLKTLLDSPAVLMDFMARQASLQGGVSARHLLAWEPDIVRSWRDSMGNCLAHYAGCAAQMTTGFGNETVAQLIRMAPEWSSATRCDGVSLLSLIDDPSQRSALEKRLIKSSVRVPKSAPKRTLKM